MSRGARRFAALGLSVVLFVAACGGDDDGVDAGAPPADGGQTGGRDGDAGALSITATPASGWTATAVGDGIKPALALDPSGTPAVVWLREALGDGSVDFASAGDDWTPQTVAEGYFYGPIDLAFDPDGLPNVVWHDHQDTQFDQAKGDLAFSRLDGSAWSTEAAPDDGHDGWDSTIVVTDDGQVWAAGIDPAQFGREDGIEFYERAADGTWTVTAVGSGPVDYEFNVALAVSPDGNPAMSWFDSAEQDLRFAERIDGDWEVQTVASDGDVGRYSSLAFDAQGLPHLSFYEQTDPSSGRILHAVRDGDAWTVEEVGTLDDVEIGMNGARRNSAVAVAEGGVVHVAFSDRSQLELATRAADGTWTVSDVLSAGERPLGQLVSLRLDADGTPHLATYEVTSPAPLEGVVVYLTSG